MVASLNSRLTLIVVIIAYANAVTIKYDHLIKRSPVPGHTVTSETIDDKHLPKDSLQRQMPKEKARFSIPFFHKREDQNGQKVYKTYYLIADKQPEIVDDSANIVLPQHAKLLREHIFIKRENENYNQIEKRNPSPVPTHYLMPHLVKPEFEYEQSPLIEKYIIASTNPEFSSEARMRINKGANALPIKSEIYGGGEEESVSMYARSPLPENKTSHTFSLKDLDILGPSPAMLLPQHANTKGLKKKGAVLMKRSDDSINTKSELQKRFYAIDQLAVLHGTKTKDEAQEHVAQQVRLGEQMAKYARLS